MKFLIEDKKAKKDIITHKYPRGNNKIKEPLENAKNIQVYVIQDEKIEYDPELGYLIETEIEKTKDKFEDNNHLLIAIQKYELKKFNDEMIVAKIQQNLGAYLDSEYPLFLRDKHARQVLFEKVDQSEIDYIKQIDAWLDECREIANQREADYLADPDSSIELLNYPPKPTKS